MGNAALCRCDGNCVDGGDTGPKTEVTLVSVTDESGPGAVSMLEQLQGKWFHERDGTPVGEISKGAMHWERSCYLHGPTNLNPVETGTLEMELTTDLSTFDGGRPGVGQRQVYRGVFEDGPEAHLKWSDGEIWVRKGPPTQQP
eukprot:gnl/TRDRNA2_/TRDRNA2_40337_c0_seq1.p1 gnl/TRDRNA2_/TRDRNA2_40337_c0~~gnl/TRDRNA2_/TRDRNA2_40337_c0_seq1.p1  ORF type:complete len:160 (-),score=21.38 gnl/TRDRNA2_/TRDRNA2_40337_c0_seq1:147-575(-)